MVEIEFSKLDSKNYSFLSQYADRVINYYPPPEIPAALVASARWPEDVLKKWFENLPYDEKDCSIEPVMPTRKDVGRDLGYSDEELLSELEVDEYYKYLISNISEEKLRELNIRSWCDAVRRVRRYIRDASASHEEICLACMGEFLRGGNAYQKESYEKYLELSSYATGESVKSLTGEEESQIKKWVKDAKGTMKEIVFASTVLGGGGALGFKVFPWILEGNIGGKIGNWIAENIFHYKPETVALSQEVYEYSHTAGTLVPSMLLALVITVPLGYYLTKKVDDYIESQGKPKELVRGLDNFENFYAEMKNGLKILVK